jgi:hypothetical protein
MKRSIVLSLLVLVFVVASQASHRGPFSVEAAASDSTVFFRDTFTEPCELCTIELASGHVPDQGRRWVLNEDTSNGVALWKNAGYRDWLSPMGNPTGARVSYYADAGASHSADYALQFQLDNAAKGSPRSFVWVMLRRTSFNTFYGGGWYHKTVSGDCYIFKVVNGAYTQLANDDCNFDGDNGTGDQVRFEAVRNVLTLYRNGAPVLSASDSTITSPGYGGLGAGNIRPSAPDDRVDSGFAVDDLVIFETPVAGVSPSLPPSPAPPSLAPAPAPKIPPPPSTPITGVTPSPAPVVSPAPPVSAPTPLPTPTPLPPAAETTSPPLPVQPGDHGYFNALVARPDHWKSFSLRDPAQLARYREGDVLDITYSPTSDTYSSPQDAAKVVIPDYRWLGETLTVPLSATDTLIPVPAGLKTGPQVSYKIDNELIAWKLKPSNGFMSVTRGAYGTTPASHAAGSAVRVGTNAIATGAQVRLPMGTENGHRYLTTWDVWFSRESKTERSGFTGWKQFQFGQGTNKGVLGLEVRTRFTRKDLVLAADEVGEVDMRAYLSLAPEVLNEPVRPMNGSFNIKAETWTRYWVLIEHVVGDWDRLSLWVADESRDPVKLLDGIRFEAESSRFHDFWLEFNTSLDEVKPNRGPVVTYVRNVVMLRDMANPASILQKPARASARSTASSTLAAPRNLRIVK